MCISQIYSNVSVLMQLDILMSLKNEKCYWALPGPHPRPAPLVSPESIQSHPLPMGIWISADIPLHEGLHYNGNSLLAHNVERITEAVIWWEKKVLLVQSMAPVAMDDDNYLPSAHAPSLVSSLLVTPSQLNAPRT